METSLSQPREGVRVPGVPLSRDPQRAAGQQRARHEAPGPAEVWLLKESARSGGAEGMAGPAGRSIPSGSPVQMALEGFGMVVLPWPGLQQVQKAFFQSFP